MRGLAYQLFSDYKPPTPEEEEAELRELMRLDAKYGHLPLFNGPLPRTNASRATSTSSVSTLERGNGSTLVEDSGAGSNTEDGLLSYEHDSEVDTKSLSSLKLQDLDLQHALANPLPIRDSLHPRIAPANRQGFQTVALGTNMYRIRIAREQWVFRYDIGVELVIKDGERGEKVISLNRGVRDDSETIRRSEIIRAALRVALEAYSIMRQSAAGVFDGQNILFTNEDIEAALKPHHGTLTLALADMPPEVRELFYSRDTAELRVTIRPTMTGDQRFRIGDIEDKVKDGKLGDVDRPLRQFYELLTNEAAAAKNDYMFFGSGRGYLTDPKYSTAIKYGQERKPGFNKGTCFVDGMSGEDRLITALVIDAKLGNFYRHEPLINMVTALCERRSPDEVTWNEKSLKLVHRQLKGIRLQTKDANKRSFVCQGLEIQELKFKTIMDCTARVHGSNIEVPLADRFKEQGILIRHMNWPVVVEKRMQGPDFYYPIEQLVVCPNQRVPLAKALENPERAWPPTQRVAMINNHLNALNLGRNNEIFAKFGVTIDTTPLQTTGFRRSAPKIEYGNNLAAPTDASKATWRSGHAKYKEGANIDMLVVIWNGSDGSGPPNSRVPPDVVFDALKNFLAVLKTSTTKKGMSIRQIEFIKEPTNLNAEMTQGNIFEKARAERKTRGPDAKIIVLYVDPAENKTHGELKYLESKYQIVTQHLALQVVQKSTRGGAATMENILAKLNMKAAGLNHVVAPEAFASSLWLGSTLIFGYDVCHPTRQTVAERALGIAADTPSVVGFSHNASRNRNLFVGDFAYQEPGERVEDSVLNERMKWMLRHWLQHRGPELPEQILVFRDGVSEGQYDMVVRNELSALEEACDEHKPGYRPRFAVTVVTKRHHKRFFRNGPRGVENPEALTVVDQDVGTAKASQYTLVHSDIPEITQDSLQSLVMALCFEHQICPMPISIPEPVYQSDEWAERGDALIKVYKDNFRLPRKGDSSNRGDDKRQPVDWAEMTKRLSYMNRPLDGRRTNA
ncbi:unnamed protein product, partial [Mesorhabditis spiculigera]